jgi:hypothetical protein
MIERDILPVFFLRFDSSAPMSHGYASLDAWISGWHKEKEYDTTLYDYDVRGIQRIRIHASWYKDRLAWSKTYGPKWTMKGDNCIEGGLTYGELETSIKVARKIQRNLETMEETMGPPSDVLDLLFRIAKILRITRYIDVTGRNAWADGRPKYKILTATDIRHRIVSIWETWAAQFKTKTENAGV